MSSKLWPLEQNLFDVNPIVITFLTSFSLHWCEVALVALNPILFIVSLWDFLELLDLLASSSLLGYGLVLSSFFILPSFSSAASLVSSLSSTNHGTTI